MKKIKVIDFMPRYQKRMGLLFTSIEIIRFIKLLKGKPKFKICMILNLNML